MSMPGVYFLALIFFFFNGEFLLWDEEFLIGSCLLGLYLFFFFSGGRLLRWVFFHKADVVYSYFYFLLQLLWGLILRIRDLLVAARLQWSAFYGLQRSLFLVCWLDPLLAQWQSQLAQAFGWGSLALAVHCYGLGFLGEAFALVEEDSFSLADVFFPPWVEEDVHLWWAHLLESF